MGSSENFCLRWNDFESNVSGAFKELREDSDFFDVTLACDNSQGRTLQAHKVILSACSSFFKQMLRNAVAASPGHPNPMLYLRGVRYSDLESVLDFMYHGEVNVAQDDLNSFLAVAEDLQVKGLTQQNTKDLGGVTKKTPARKSAGGTGGGAAKRRRQQQQQDDLDDDMDFPDVKNEPAASSTLADIGGGTSASGTEGFTGGIENFEETYGGFSGESAAPGAAGTSAAAAAAADGSMLSNEDEGLDDSSKVTDLNELVMGLLTYADGIHTCNLCGKKSPWRTTMLRHVEANHVETAGHVCDICGQVSKTRHAFAMHKKRKHKVNLDNEPLPDRPPPQQQQVAVAQQQQTVITTVPEAVGSIAVVETIVQQTPK